MRATLALMVMCYAGVGRALLVPRLDVPPVARTDVDRIAPPSAKPEPTLRWHSWSGHTSASGTSRPYRAHMAVLDDPLSFGFAVPAGGCFTRHNTTVSAHEAHCRYATNGGFFSWSGGCLGNIVINGTAMQLPGTGNANFGVLKDRTMVAGFVAPSSLHPPGSDKLQWQQLLSGSGWLVRDGASYVRKSSDLDVTSSFVTEKAPRTGVGAFKNGSVALLQVDGEEDIKAGLDLFEFADVWQTTGIAMAINLDGGGSSVSVLDGRVISHPTCDDTPVECQRAVTTITCMR